MVDWKYYAKWAFGITAGGLVLDNFTGAEALESTGLSGASSFLSNLRSGGGGSSTSTTKKKAS